MNLEIYRAITIDINLHNQGEQLIFCWILSHWPHNTEMTYNIEFTRIKLLEIGGRRDLFTLAAPLLILCRCHPWLNKMYQLAGIHPILQFLSPEICYITVLSTNLIKLIKCFFELCDKKIISVICCVGHTGPPPCPNYSLLAALQHSPPPPPHQTKKLKRRKHPTSHLKASDLQFQLFSDFSFKELQ